VVWSTNISTFPTFEADFSMWNVENKKFPFKATAGWVQDFKKKHKIRQTYVTKYISSKDNATFDETVKNSWTVSKTYSYKNPNHYSHSQMWIKEKIKYINAKI
jgi:hypothetical protein